MIINESDEAVKKAVDALNKGGIVICPTDTVYGFLADAQNKKAVEKIFKIKRRPKSKPLPIFVKDFAAAKQIAEINNEGERIIKKYWPGKVTFVLKSRRDNKIYGADKNTIAIRIPKYKFLNDLLKKAGKPLVQTSVNISGEKPLKLAEIIEKFGKNSDVNAIVQGKDLLCSKPSKIIDITRQLTILR